MTARAPVSRVTAGTDSSANGSLTMIRLHGVAAAHCRLPYLPKTHGVRPE